MTLLLLQELSIKIESMHSNSNIEIRVLTDNDSLWDQIDSVDTYSLYHKREWKNLIEETFGNFGYYLAASDSGILIDVLPLFLIKNPIMGKKLVSTPYEGCSGGFSSSNVEARHKIISEILKNARQLNVKYVEIRSLSPIEELKQYGFLEATPFVIFEVPLINLDENFKMLSANHRRNVRIAKKKRVSVVLASRWEEMNAFYNILSDHYKTIGLPFFGRMFFKKIWCDLVVKKHASLLLAKKAQKIIGGHLLFFSGKKIVSKYSAYRKDLECKKINASYALFWEGVRLGIERKCSVFNLGITGEHNTGLLDFKTRFGADKALVHFYSLPVSGNVPDYALYYNSFQLPKKIWKIAPYGLTNFLGQKINKWIC